MMNCKNVLALLPSDLSGKCPQIEALEIAEHLKGCRSCSIVYESARETVERVSGAGSGNGAVSWRNRETEPAPELPANEMQTGGGK